jgi:hypothetical protein
MSIEQDDKARMEQIERTIAGVRTYIATQPEDEHENVKKWMQILEKMLKTAKKLYADKRNPREIWEEHVEIIESVFRCAETKDLDGLKRILPRNSSLDAETQRLKAEIRRLREELKRRGG